MTAIHLYERLRELFTYSPETGLFHWKVQRGAKKPGDLAGCRDKDGYIVIRFDGVLYKAHRLAWLYMTRDIPEGDIDHENRVTGDNRWSNLRPATRSQNLFNRPAKGCHFYARTNKWQAQLRANGQRYHLGYFDTEVEAREAYAKASALHHQEFARVA